MKLFVIWAYGYFNCHFHNNFPFFYNFLDFIMEHCGSIVVQNCALCFLSVSSFFLNIQYISSKLESKMFPKMSLNLLYFLTCCTLQKDETSAFSTIRVSGWELACVIMIRDLSWFIQPAISENDTLSHFLFVSLSLSFRCVRTECFTPVMYHWKLLSRALLFFFFFAISLTFHWFQ